MLTPPFTHALKTTHCSGTFVPSCTSLLWSIHPHVLKQCSYLLTHSLNLARKNDFFNFFLHIKHLL